MQSITNCSQHKCLFQFNLLAIFIFLFITSMGFGQSYKNERRINKANEDLIREYIESKGRDIITFDASNIKQFWVNNTVLSREGTIQIMVKEDGAQFSSDPLRIQLANVNETLDCSIEVITETPDLTYNVLSNEMKPISEENTNKVFLDYQIISSKFHLEDTTNLSFFFKFNTKKDSYISIKSIILSFSTNRTSSFLSSPGELKLSADMFSGKAKIEKINDTSFSVTGAQPTLTFKNKILLSDKPITHSVTIKNTGDSSTSVFVGYMVYTMDGLKIENRNNPRATDNEVLTVISSKKGSSSIVVDSFPQWTKGDFLVLNAKEDLSDFPNHQFFEEQQIQDVKKIDKKTTEIVFKEPIKSTIEKGTKVRIQKGYGGLFFYANILSIQPGKEVKVTSSKSKNNKTVYNYDGFCKGSYYLVPAIFSESQNSSITISDYSISY